MGTYNCVEHYIVNYANPLITGTDSVIGPLVLIVTKSSDSDIVVNGRNYTYISGNLNSTMTFWSGDGSTLCPTSFFNHCDSIYCKNVTGGIASQSGYYYVGRKQ